jgi:PTS system galactitol-specific IIC component
VLPGNKTLPLGDLPSLISQVAVIVLVSRGNVFRSVIAGIPLVIAYLLIASNLAPLITRLSQEVGATFPEGAVITAFTDGGNPVRYWVLELFTGNWIAFSVIPVVGFLYFLSWKNYKKSMNEK